jgi:hypothetical protein
MENLIPLLIIIVVAIISSANQKKKREQRRNISTPRTKQQQENDFLGWLEKLGVEEDEIPPVRQTTPFAKSVQKDEVKEAPVEVKTPPKDSILNKYSQYSGFISPEEREQIMAKEGVSSLKPKKEEHDLTVKEDEEIEKEIKKPKIEFNLKQAVIYSEILNRKYV